VNFSKYPPPELILADIRSLSDRYGSVVLAPLEDQLILHTEDPAGFVDGNALPLRLASHTVSGATFEVRDYQQDAVSAFWEI